MTTKVKFISILVLGCLLSMISVSGRQRNEEELPAPGLNISRESAGIPIVVTGTLIDGTGAEPVPEAVVVIKDRYITAVGSRKDIKIPENARVFSFPHGTLLPGFINAHVHSKYDEKKLQTWAREGVTTVRDLAEGDFSTHLVRFQGEWHVNPWVAVIGNLQYDDVTQTMGMFARLRWILRPGSDLYVVYTHNWIQDPTRPNRHVFNTYSGAATMKLNYTHRF